MEVHFKMATEAQIAANRRNAQKSTGPKTANGKTAVAQNAVKHGFSAQSVINYEDRAEFELYRQQFLEELAPESPMESMLAERVVNLSWRLKRANRIQNQTIDAMNSPKKSTLPKEIESMMAKFQARSSQSSPELPLGRLAIKDFANDRVLERLLMYERRLESSLYKTILELQRLNLVRNLKNKKEVKQLI
jgi:O-methyltransferase involved in polyketide biosynthesis